MDYYVSDIKAPGKKSKKSTAPKPVVIKPDSAGGIYAAETTVSDYYINDGKTIIAVEYSYGTANNFQAGFDQLATKAVIKK